MFVLLVKRDSTFKLIRRFFPFKLRVVFIDHSLYSVIPIVHVKNIAVILPIALFRVRLIIAVL